MYNLASRQKYVVVLAAILLTIILTVCVYILSDEKNRTLFFGSRMMPPDSPIFGVSLGMNQNEALINIYRHKLTASDQKNNTFICPPVRNLTYDRAYLIEDNTWRMGIGCLYIYNGRVVWMDYGSAGLVI